MSFTDRELLARLIMCEAGNQGEIGMKAVATVIMNRVQSQNGEYSRISEGGNIRNIIFQKYQFTCATANVNGKYNSQNIYNMNPEPIHFEIADWALSGNKLNEVGNCLWFMNPFKKDCPSFFPYNKSGKFHTKIYKHCFFTPTSKYYKT